MASIYQFLATSDHPAARAVRGLRRGILGFTVPAPRFVIKPMLWAYLGLRSVYYFGKRVLICEPLFKAYCQKYGRGLRTGVYVHFVEGKGDIIVGDDVVIDGKSTFGFAAAYSLRPTLTVGDRTSIGNGCRFGIGKRVTIGRDCLIAAQVWIFDSSGHPADPEARRARRRPAPEEVRPVVIEDNVWIGGRSIIGPGVKVGEGSIVSANSVVRSNVRPYTIVAGNPARKIADLPRPACSRPLAAGPAQSADGAATLVEAATGVQSSAKGENP